MKTLLRLVLLGGLLAACRHEATIVPEAARVPVIAAYPQAENLQFTPLEKDRIWQVNFMLQGTRYNGATSLNQLLVAFPTGQSVPDSLVGLTRRTLVAGGICSNLHDQKYTRYQNAANFDQRMLADYDWRGTRYTFRWGITNINGRLSYVTELLPYRLLEYRTETLAHLPGIIQQYLQKQEATFSYALVRVGQQNQKQYEVAFTKNGEHYALWFNHEGRPTAVAYAPKPQYLDHVFQLPAPIQAYLRDTPEMAGFGLTGDAVYGGIFLPSLSVSTFDGLTTYGLTLQNRLQAWFMRFDGNGKLIQRQYISLL